MMFKLIGGAIVCGFALYGLAIYLDRTNVKVVFNLGDARQVAKAAAITADADAADASDLTAVVGSDAAPDAV
ncbi:hypothetical protein [Pseudoxanthomonas sp.]|uniref:hypothetical protein n=1 Tax=Pseudoxanthomonas sp. TaxID=1871049 RepID=UPI0035B20A11